MVIRMAFLEQGRCWLDASPPPRNLEQETPSVCSVRGTALPFAREREEGCKAEKKPSREEKSWCFNGVSGRRPTQVRYVTCVTCAAARKKRVAKTHIAVISLLITVSYRCVAEKNIYYEILATVYN